MSGSDWWLAATTMLATVVVAVATVTYVVLVYRQLRLGEPRVSPYVASRNGRPFVNVTNTGAATAYKVLVRIDWPQPPVSVAGVPESVESPMYEKLLPGETLSFESPHDLVGKDHFDDATDYRVAVSVAYEALGRSRREPSPFTLDYGHHIRQMRQARQRSQP